jgi:Flp pilus assembly protein TadG
MTRLRAIRSRLGHEHGVVAVLVAMCMILLLGAAALGVDLGYNYLQQRRLQASVDFALMAGAQKLPDASGATSVAQTFLTQNWTQNGNSTAPDQTAITTCQFNPNYPHQPCTSSSPACTTGQPCQLNVSASASVPTFFGRIFGDNSTTVSAQGSACGGCSTITQKYDVMIVLDRSFSMCLNSQGFDGCSAIAAQKSGVDSLLGEFDPNNVKVGLTLLPPENQPTENNGTSPAPITSCLVVAAQVPNGSCANSSGAQCGGSGGSSTPCTAPCDTISLSDAERGGYNGSLGEFMMGLSDTYPSASTNPWVVSPLPTGPAPNYGFGTSYAGLESIVNCVQAKYWTPMAPAIQAATNALNADTTPNVDKIIIYEGDGGGDSQPMQLSSGNPTNNLSWYTPTPGNGQHPCEDAVQQAANAKADNITIYTIGYNLGASNADNCYDNNAYPNDIDPQSATTTLQDIASPGDFYQAPDNTTLEQIFQTVGKEIVDSSTRITS